MSNTSRPSSGAPKVDATPDKQGEAGSADHPPRLWTPPSTGNTLFGRRSSSDAGTNHPLVIDPLDVILADESPESPSPRWDFTANKPTPSSPDTTPSPGAKPPNQHGSNSSSPCGTKVRRPDSESNGPRPINIFSPYQRLRGIEDSDDALEESKIRPPDPTPAGELEDSTGSAQVQDLRRTSSAPLGRSKRCE
ncbi:hypothetical protein VM1G_04485 [Cytospora mali]|uniref:Uncharacterized protein n=1 Tax=Cytospora mali TaxID=578113 RepID=A0A194VYC9_CYTMA|nr:hypothetical protein VM1G_04485 [Valsa mali]